MRYMIFSLLLAAGFAVADPVDRPFLGEDVYENPQAQDPEAWKEQALVLPPFPAEKDLLEFDVDLPGSPFTYSLDAKTLSVGEDGVVRYTLVIRSKSGAWNVSREGMRCTTRELKIYAYGSKRGGFRPLKNPRWEKMKLNDPTRYHMELKRFYFCLSDQPGPNTAEEIVQLLRGGPRRNPSPSFF